MSGRAIAAAALAIAAAFGGGFSIGREAFPPRASGPAPTAPRIRVEASLPRIVGLAPVTPLPELRPARRQAPTPRPRSPVPVVVG